MWAVGVTLYAGACRDPGHQMPAELKLQMVVGHPTCMLGTKSRSSTTAMCALTSGLSLALLLGYSKSHLSSVLLYCIARPLAWLTVIPQSTPRKCENKQACYEQSNQFNKSNIRSSYNCHVPPKFPFLKHKNWGLER